MERAAIGWMVKGVRKYITDYSSARKGLRSLLGAFVHVLLRHFVFLL